MIGLSQLYLIALGIVLVLIVQALGLLYWRYLGSGSIQDYVSKEEEPDGDYRIIKRLKTSTQRIALVEHQGQMLVYANGDVMFGTTEDEEIYAEALIHVPMAAAGKREHILIIGGGGGITTREVLRYPEVKEITTVDIDSIMMDFGKNLEALVKFNEGALNHSKVRTVIEDGRNFIENTEGKWDAIFVDIPEPSEELPELSRLFSWEFFRLLKDHLEPDGVINISCPSLAKIPDYFWSVQATLVAAGFHVLPYHFDVIVEYENDYGFCMATNHPVIAEDIIISVPTRFLSPERVQDMFYIPYNYSKSWSNYKIQTDHNLVLADIADQAWGDD
jgi:spermidine synthase